MAGKSNIEWTDKTWNPTSGCTQISPGCAHCYAMVLAERFRGVPGHYYEKGFDVQLRPSQLLAPTRWKAPSRIFVDSMSDLFHEAIPDEYRDQCFAVMAITPRHTYQLLTKRPERMREYFADLESRVDAIGEAIFKLTGKYASADPPDDEYWLLDDLPLPNVWLGVTVENQHFAEERIPILLDTPAAVRFLSCEPLLEPVGITYPGNLLPTDLEPRVDWVIVGGESGRGHRPFDPDWARSLLEDCSYNRTPFFMKQLGSGGPADDPKCVKLENLPEDLRVRQFPA